MLTQPAGNRSMLDMFVPGIPQAQGSLRGFRVANGVRLAHNNSRDLGIWRAAITHHAADLWGDTPPLDRPTTVAVMFLLPRPPSIPKRRVYPDRKPDLDKLARAVLDSLTGVVFVDDARVVDLIVSKRYVSEHAPGAHIAVCPVEDVGAIA